jgi:pyruvate dehydrogenase complex dehydrogenase (E1) component
MKTKEQHQTKETVTDKLRKIRNKLSFEMKDMTHEQIKEYLNKEKTLHSVSAWKSDISKV